jgi:hypothetical protein
VFKLYAVAKLNLILCFSGDKLLINISVSREISSSHGGEYVVQNCLLGCSGV